MFNKPKVPAKPAASGVDGVVALLTLMSDSKGRKDALRAATALQETESAARAACDEANEIIRKLDVILADAEKATDVLVNREEAFDDRVAEVSIQQDRATVSHMAAVSELTLERGEFRAESGEKSADLDARESAAADREKVVAEKEVAADNRESDAQKAIAEAGAVKADYETRLAAIKQAAA